MECVHLTPLSFTHTLSHPCSCRREYAPAHNKPLSWCRLCWWQEWVELMWNVWSLDWLWSRQTHTVLYLPVCAPVKHVYYQRPLSELRGILGISATQRLSLLVPPCPARTLFTQRHGGWTPFTHREERKQWWDTGKKSARHMKTRVSVWGAKVWLFLELQRIHLMNLHNWNSTHVSK